MIGYSVWDFDSEILGQLVWVLEDVAQVALVVVEVWLFGVGLLVCCGEVTEVGFLILFGFREIEILVILEILLSSELVELLLMICIVMWEDVEVVVDIVWCVFYTDCWHCDLMIFDDWVDVYKVVWVGNDVLGWAVVVLLVIDDVGRVLGFNVLLLCGDVMVVDLIVVVLDYQGQGIGCVLMAVVFVYGAGRVRVLQVGIQAENHAFLCFYEGLGMWRIGIVMIWYWMLQFIIIFFGKVGAVGYCPLLLAEGEDFCQCCGGRVGQQGDQVVGILQVFGCIDGN